MSVDAETFLAEDASGILQSSEAVPADRLPELRELFRRRNCRTGKAVAAVKAVITAIRLTTSQGEKIIIAQVIDRIVYTKRCPYLHHEFETEDAQRVFCTDSHQVMYCKKFKS